MFSPKWFLTNLRDKNGVYNGVEMKEFSPNSSNCNGMEIKDGCNTCRLTGKVTNPEVCDFMVMYRKKLDKKVNFKSVMEKFKELAEKYNADKMVLCVYESPNNPCSERSEIIKFFRKYGVKVEEFDRSKVNNAK